MAKLIRLHFVSSTIFLIFCFVLQVFVRHYDAFPWLNFLVWLTLFVITIVNPLWALAVLVFLLPFTAGIHEQIKALLHINIFTLDLLSCDASIGFLSGLIIVIFWNQKAKLYRENISDKVTRLELLLLIFHILIIITSAIAISRNLYQSTSFLSVKGFFYNLTNVRYTSFFDDYFPLRDIFLFTTAITLSIRLLTLVRTKSQLYASVLIPISIATTIILGYALCSKLTGLGYNRDGVTVGVNSFFPDLHAYGGYALAAFIGSLYYLSSNNSLVKFTACTFSLLSAAGVVVSASRFSIALLFSITLAYIGFLLIKRNENFFLNFAILGLTILATAILLRYSGDRDLIHQLALLSNAKSFQETNVILSYRPEIFRSVILMYSHYPILGLGKGIFYRQSSIAEFSHSAFFSELNNGENAHNYFLQILAETGIVGLFVFCAIFIYQALRLRNRRTEIVTILILGIFSGNLYGHSLLIHNLLLLLFILLGGSNIDVEEVEQKQRLTKVLPENISKPWRYFIITAATILLIGAISEVKSSYGKLPFQPHFVCYKPEYYSDHQTSGLVEKTYKMTGNHLQLDYFVHHADAQRRPLTIDFNIEQQGQTITSYKRTINSPGSYVEQFDISKVVPGSDFLLRIKTSRCFIPINLGVNWDNRPLGIQITQVSQDERGI